MNRYVVALSAAVLSVLSFTVAADTRAEAEQQVALHTAMGAQARASKDFGMAAHCTRLVEKYTEEARGTAVAAEPQDHSALAAQADRNADAHRAMLATASTHRDPGMAAHCRQQIDRYAAEAAAHRAQAAAGR